jgi:hypothetical protein
MMISHVVIRLMRPPGMIFLKSLVEILLEFFLPRCCKSFSDRPIPFSIEKVKNIANNSFQASVTKPVSSRIFRDPR